MKLSTRARYALRMLIDIHLHSSEGHPVQLGKVAKRTQLSRGYLEQLMLSMKNASLLRGVSGRNGGYLLTRPAKEITIAEIVEAAIGPIGIVDCIADPENCMRSEFCNCHLLWSLVSWQIKATLNAFTLEDLAEGNWRETVKRFLSEKAFPPPFDDEASMPPSLTTLFEDIRNVDTTTG